MERDIVMMRVDTSDPNFKDTPERVAKAFNEMILPKEQIRDEIKKILSKAFPTDYSGMIFVSDIISHSICPHHLLPVEYDSTIAYIPYQLDNSKYQVIGLSKIIRIAQLLSKQAILQETYTLEVARIFYSELGAKGVAVVVKGIHNCIRCRGVRSLSPVITSVMEGAFMDNASTRQEFFQLLAHSRG